MSQSVMPLSYHPTTVVLVDDNRDFLSLLKQSLNKKGIPCLSFDDPDQALAYLEGLPFKNKLTAACEFQDDEAHLHDGKRIELNLKNLYKEIYNPKRFSEVGIVISDYDMPQMKGDTFFGTLSNRYMRRIMLTGEADYQLAIRLLNRKFIHNFAEKKPLTAADNVYQQILKLQLDYFNELSAPISEYLLNNTPYIMHADYYNLVNSVIKENKIVEHYTFSEAGSKIMLDGQGNIYFLILATEDEMKSYYDIAYFAEVTESVINSLQNRSHVPLLLTSEELYDAPEKWENRMIPVKKTILNNMPIYYGVSHIKKLDDKKIASFNSVIEY